jgi:capsular exopolysaccharide synthesis family protein
MSKFFNETRGAQHDTPIPSLSRLGVQDVEAALKRSIETNGSTPESAGHVDLKLLTPLKESQDIVAQVVERRLELCRSIKLPRTEERSFLVAQYDPCMQMAVEAYRCLRTRLEKQQIENGARSLVISSAHEGEGKTLTAFNLALCYANFKNWPVLLVDADLRTGGLSTLLADSESPGLARILERGCEYHSAILRTDLPNLYVLPAGTAGTSPSELFSAPNWKEFIGWASETFRVVIVDSPPVLSLADFELVMAPCESAMLVVRARRTSRDALHKMLAQIDPKKVAGVVFNADETPTRRSKPYAVGA